MCPEDDNRGSKEYHSISLSAYQEENDHLSTFEDESTLAMKATISKSTG